MVGSSVILCIITLDQPDVVENFVMASGSGALIWCNRQLLLITYSRPRHSFIAQNTHSIRRQLCELRLDDFTIVILLTSLLLSPVTLVAQATTSDWSRLNSVVTGSKLSVKHETETKSTHVEQRYGHGLDTDGEELFRN